MEYRLLPAIPGGLKEQMDNGNLGLFSTPGDADSLMKQMEYFLIHPDFYIKEKKKASVYLQSLNWDTVTQKIIQI